MRQNTSTGNESTAGPVGLPEKYIVDCPDCDFREVAQDGEWAADSLACSHAGETDHDLPEVRQA